MAATSADPPALCLDLTRLVSRVGRGAPTGVDRVERAYLDRLLSGPDPAFAVARTALGHVLLDADGARAIADRLDGRTPWGPPDLIGRLSRRLDPPRRAAEADLRRLAAARFRRGALARGLARALPPGTRYFNVGHSNLTDESLGAFATQPGGSVSVLVHDTIPLDFPEYQRPGTVPVFEHKLRRVFAHATRVICNSRQTEADVRRWAARWDSRVDTLVAPLGVDLAAPDPAALPPGLPPPAPYFVTLGTVEPRKDHALLLDIWDRFAADPPPGGTPHLAIAGARGWANEAVFARLDALPAGSPVHEAPGLSDGAVAALLQGSAGLLFPSRAEGYGLPPLEAAALGVPVVCCDLPVYRETLGNIAVYLKPGDVYQWQKTIIRLTEEARAGKRQADGPQDGPTLPTWAHHFNVVLSVA